MSDLQAVLYQYAGKSHRVVRLQLVHAVSCALERLLALQEHMESNPPGTVAVGCPSRVSCSSNKLEQGAKPQTEHSGAGDAAPAGKR